MIDLASSSSLSYKLARNTFFNFAGRFGAMVVTLFLTPYIISQLGVRRFGVWSLILVIASCVGLLDLGLRASFVKYVAEYHARRDYEAINRVLNSGLALYLILSLVIIAAGFILRDPILRLFKIPTDLFADARFVLLVAMAIYSLSNVFGLFQAVMTGLQRMDVTNLIALGVSVFRVLGTVLSLELGYGLRGLIASEALALALTALLLVLSAFRLLPQLQVSWAFYDWPSLRRLLSYGIKVQVSRLADLAISQTDKLLLGYFLGLSPVAFYEVGSRVVLTSKRLSRVLISAIVPAVAEMDAREDQISLCRLYLRGSKYLVMVVAPVLLFIAAAAPLILTTWMGEGYELSVPVIRFLALGHLVHLLTGVGTTTAKGMGKPEYETRYSLLLLAMNTLLGIALVIRLGFWGVLIATPLSLIISSLYFMVLFHRLLGIPLVQFLRDTYLQPLITCSLAGLPLLTLNAVILRTVQARGRLVNLTILGAEGLLFVAIYGGLMLKTAYLDDYDRGLLKHLGQSLLRA